MPPPPQQIALAQRYGRQYGVDPRLLLAIGGHETQWGTTGAGRPSQGGYALGYGVSDSGIMGGGKYAGFANQYRYGASTLSKWGARTMADVMAGKAAPWATDPHWEQGVAGVYRSLGGKLRNVALNNLGVQAPMIDTGRVTHSFPTQAAAPIPRPPMVQMPQFHLPSAPSIMPFVSSIISSMRSDPQDRLANTSSAVANMTAQGTQYSDQLRASRAEFQSNMREAIAQARQQTAQYMALAQGGTPPQPATAPEGAAKSSPSTPEMKTIKGALAEAFYDPIGQWDNGRFSPQGIGNHSDHVHFSIINPRAMVMAIGQAQKMGLRVGENPYVDKVDPVHVKDSFHYRGFPNGWQGRPLGQAIDVSGDPRQMAAFFRWGLQNLR